jgi:hypothetical protein
MISSDEQIASVSKKAFVEAQMSLEGMLSRKESDSPIRKYAHAH